MEDVSIENVSIENASIEAGRNLMMKKRKVLVYLLTGMMTLSLAACGKGDKTEQPEGKKSVEEQQTYVTEEDAKKSADTKQSEETKKPSQVNHTSLTEEELYEELFDIQNTISIQLEISQEELDKLQQDYIRYDTHNSKSPIYRIVDKAVITIDEEVFEIEEVGIRLKGNTSRVPVYDKKTGGMNLSHYKLSFNETFDDETYYGEDAKVWESETAKQERKDRRFATLKELEIKWNKNYDDTHIREYYANMLFRKAGVLAQQLNLCSLGVNGDNFGVVNIYEPVDKIFIERNLPQEDWGGDLYKCGWTMRPANYVKSSVTYGIADKDNNEFYNYSLKTNKKNSAHESLINLLTVLDTDNVSQEDFESVIDTGYLVKFLAASYFMGDPDDFRNNYNNHYLYFLKSNGKAIFIPYDNDRCLGLTHSWNPDGSGMTAVSPYSNKAVGNDSKQRNPIIISAILKDGYYVDAYTEELQNIAKWPEWETENFEQIYQMAKTNYEQVITPDIDFENVKEEFKFSLDGEFTTGKETNMSYQEYVERLMATLQKAFEKGAAAE